MDEPKLYYVSCPAAGGGHRMAWWQWGSARASRVLVCVHGLSRQGRDFDSLARALLVQHPDWRIVCPDVVGRGRSDWLRDPLAYQLPTYAADMLAMLARIHRMSPVAQLDWVGTSMGGLIGLALAGTPGLPLPAPIGRLVLNDVGPVIQWAAIQRIGQYVGQAGTFVDLASAAGAMRAVSTGFGPHTDEAWLALSQPMVRPASRGELALHYDPAIGMPMRNLTPETVTQGEAALWALYEKVTASTLLLRGVDSDLLSRETAREMASRGPRARIVEFPGVGHAPMLTAPDQIECVAGFLLGVGA